MNCSDNIIKQETTIVTAASSAQQSRQLTASADPEMDRFVDELMEKMTLEENRVAESNGGRL